MSTRAAPGPQLSAGRLRVDAARAIAKLREYQLVDRTAWVLEAIRAAVASGASAITLSGDANDVWLAWEGTPWPADDLPRLFDELVSPEPTEERHHLRLLAAAVNSGLGIDPAFIDIYAVSTDGTVRARYTPDVLIETADIEDSALRKVTAEPASAPAGIGFPTGMILHLRRRAAIGMLTYLFWEREPPELLTARVACRDIAVPITIGNTVCSRAQHGADLVRVPFEGDLDGFVALVDPAAPRPPHPEISLEVAERGVVLAHYTLPVALHGNTGAYEARGPMPLRVFVDAKRMPSNASRSQVRREVPPIATAEQRAPALIEKVLATLAKDTATADCDPKKRAAALAIIAAAIAGPEWSTRAFTERLGELAKVPLLRDATGAPRPVGHAWSGHVYTGRKPLAPELAPWVQSILWVAPGDPAATILAGSVIDHRDTKRRLKWAKQQRKAHRKFFAHAPRTAGLTVKRAPRLRVTLGARVTGSAVPESWFAGIKGEVGVSFDRGDGEILVLFQGRPLERVVIASPIGFDAVVDAEHLTPGDGYKSVSRDAYFAIVERAVQAALICAAEAIAVGIATPSVLPAGFVEGTRSSSDVEARVIRAAMGISKDLQLPRSYILAKAPAWPTIDGGWIDFRSIAGEQVIGVASTINRVRLPASRRVLAGNGQLLARLMPGTRVVDYDKCQVDGDPALVPERLARQLAGEHMFALAIRGDDVRGAIAPTRTRSLVHLHHLGHALDKREYIGTFGGCTLAVDSDDIVPDVAWKAAGDTAEVHARDYREWEVALLRATLRSLIGDRPPELIGPPITALDNALVEWAFDILRDDDGFKLLDPTLDARLIADLKAARIIHVLGERDLISIEQLAARFPTRIFHVDKLAAPVVGFAPMVARPMVAEVISRLAGIPIADGHAELAVRRKLAEREARLEAHRKLPARELAYPFWGTRIAIDGVAPLSFRGVVGVGRNRLEIEVRIENRTFQTLTRSDELPLYAVIDLDIKHADDQFLGLSELVTRQLIERVKASAPALLAAVASSEASSELADAGHTRTLLYKWMSGAPSAASTRTVREAVSAAPAFFTIYKTRLSLVGAAKPNYILRTSAWNDDWLGPADGEAASAFDEGVLQLLEDDTQLSTLLTLIHPGKVVDVSGEIVKLQSSRRMARGLIPIPTLPHIPAELKRKLSELGDVGKRLGHGEIGLVAEGSSALVHDHGTLRQRLTLDVSPSIQLAIEAPELVDGSGVPGRGLDLAGDVADQLARLRDLGARPANPASATLTGDARELAIRLLREVLASSRDVPARIKGSIRRGLLRCHIPYDVAGTLPVFELLDGSWVAIDAIDKQIARFGNAWAVTRSTALRPLDKDRLVLVLSPDELGAAAGHYTVIDAAGELALDDQARRNQAKRPVAALDLRGRDYLLAEVELDGDGKTGPRGIVAPLLPHAADQRGIFPHRNLVPFALTADPCRWPTLAIVDDARLEPDRTWERPRTNTMAWTELTSRISATSERALTSLVPARESSLAHVYVGAGISLGQRVAGAKLQIRGAVWLGGPPRVPIWQLEVYDAYGHHLHGPEHPLGMGGTLYVHAPEGWDRERTLADIVPRLYGHLVSQLIGRVRSSAKPPSDVVAAHIATALAIKTTEPADVGAMTFPCFRPAPLNATALARLFANRDDVPVLPIAELEAELHDPDVEGVIEDGSELSQAVIARLGARATRGDKRKKPPKPFVFAPPPARDEPKTPVMPELPKPAPKPKAPAAIHPIQNVVDAVHAKLVDRVTATFSAGVAEVTSPIVGFSQVLEFAARDPRLHAIANALRANSPWAPMAIDALAAHAITVLDAAYSEVNQQTVSEVLSELLVES